jgi:hypothetical protein
MLKNDVEKYLKANGIKEGDLNETATRAFTIYKKIKAIHERNPDDQIMKQNAEKNGNDVIELIKRELSDKTNSPELRKKAAKAITKKRQGSLKQLKKSEKAVGELEQCRVKLREDRKQKLASGEIKSPVRKSRVTKVKESFTRILKLMPSEDQKVIDQSEQLLRKCATELFKINEMNKIQVVVKELEIVGDKKSPKKQKETSKAA